MPVICIGSVCFSLFQIAIIVFFIINYFSSFFKKFFTSLFYGYNELEKEIREILIEKRKNKEFEESHYIELNENDNLKDIFSKTKNLSIVLKFGAKWCQPCNYIKKYFKNQINSYDVTLIDIDVDINKNLKYEYKITALPTFKFYFFLDKKWTMVHEIKGAKESELENAFNKFCLSRK